MTPAATDSHALARARDLGPPPLPADLAGVLAWLTAQQDAIAACALGTCGHPC